MLKVSREWATSSSKALLLQMHDELIAEVSEDEIQDSIEELSRCMCDAGRDYRVRVPLRVSARVGRTWHELTEKSNTFV